MSELLSNDQPQIKEVCAVNILKRFPGVLANDEVWHHKKECILDFEKVDVLLRRKLQGEKSNEACTISDGFGFNAGVFGNQRLRACRDGCTGSCPGD